MDLLVEPDVYCPIIDNVGNYVDAQHISIRHRQPLL